MPRVQLPIGDVPSSTDLLEVVIDARLRHRPNHGSAGRTRPVHVPAIPSLPDLGRRAPHSVVG